VSQVHLLGREDYEKGAATQPPVRLPCVFPGLLCQKGAKNINLIEEAGPKKGGSRMEYNHGQYKGGTISPICVQNADFHNS